MSEPSYNDVVARLRAAGCVFAEDEALLLLGEDRSAAELAGMIERRISGVPLEYVLGWVEFCGRRYAVDAGVFVPRRRTEYLVELAVGKQVGTAVEPPTKSQPTVVVDLCCGSGAIGAAVAAQLEAKANRPTELYATDIDPTAVLCAAKNLADVGGTVLCGDLYHAFPANLRGRVDLLVVNAPYVPSDSIRLMPPEARLYEPWVTLDGGADGLAVQRRIAADAGDWLAPGGRLFIETSEQQAPQTRQLLEQAGLMTTVEHSEDLDATVVAGRKPAGSPKETGR
ncbi:putative protein N(5)-glutamine methyltransferase [Arthrobacter sp. M4]|uniref:putative protein N(5)-glutamine methyltransferase n=1 Tax=Arthrobacter sp. M4 TaxID=218160 RepID=UPI001CDB6DE2|nr:putative protein N(5)-glutamine methyltransferase [Arthrobacter sp. M4]MCA4133330.1 putative protein N(5)-glutamine methyltransferase [Arthrobacter sp. M4]